MKRRNPQPGDICEWVRAETCYGLLNLRHRVVVRRVSTAEDRYDDIRPGHDLIVEALEPSWYEDGTRAPAGAIGVTSPELLRVIDDPADEQSTKEHEHEHA